MIKYEKLENHVFVTKLAGFEHSKYIQYNETESKVRDDDIPLVQGQNIRNGNFVEKYNYYISKEISDNLSRSKLDKICILIPYVGSNLGEVGIFYHPYDCHMASNIAKIELIDDYFDIEYLKYYLQSPVGQGYLFIEKQGSAQPNITMQSIRNTLVLDKSKSEQTKIARILKEIDDKININFQIKNTLEEMMKTLYQRWFLEFEFPNEKGKPYKSSGGKMVWNSELKKEIPGCWKVLDLKNILNVITGKEDANFSTKNGKYSFFTCSNDILKCDTPAFRGKAILIAGNGDFNVKYFDGEFNAYQRTYVLIPKEEKYIGEIYINSINTINKFKKGSNGSIVKFITKGDVENIKILVPDNEILLLELNKILNIVQNYKNENEKLIELRNDLLPMLMNGQINVDDVQI
ncbi:MAG: restriction endonuclease subunit S [Clostridia bacterium]|nr:restriction endonuclease subunit S [Clostridia bacterium]